MYIYIYIHTYIYREREIQIYIYIYICTCVYTCYIHMLLSYSKLSSAPTAAGMLPCRGTYDGLMKHCYDHDY